MHRRERDGKLNFEHRGKVVLTLHENRPEAEYLTTLRGKLSNKNEEQNLRLAIEDFGKWIDLYDGDTEVGDLRLETVATIACAIRSLIQEEEWYEYWHIRRNIIAKFHFRLRLDGQARESKHVTQDLVFERRVSTGEFRSLCELTVTSVENRNQCRSDLLEDLEELYEEIKKLHEETKKNEETKKIVLNERLQQLLETLQNLPEIVGAVLPDPDQQDTQYLREFCAMALVWRDAHSEDDLIKANWNPSSDDIRAIRHFLILAEPEYDDQKRILDGHLEGEGPDHDIWKQNLNLMLKQLKGHQISAGRLRQIVMACVQHHLQAYDFKAAADTIQLSLGYRESTAAGTGSSGNNPSGVQPTKIWPWQNAYKATTRWIGSIIDYILLWLPMQFYVRADRIAYGLAFVFGVLMLPTILPGSESQADSDSILSLFAEFLLHLNQLFLIAVYVTVAVTSAVIVFRTRQTHLPYFQLYFPRLFGAIIAAFAILIFDNTSWQMGINVPLFSLAAIGFLSVLGASGYLFFDVQSMRFTTRNIDWNTALQAARKLFWIAVSQALVVAIVITTLLAPAMDLGEGRYVSIELGFLATRIYPTLVLLWAVVALFVGTFVQMLWQGTRLTEPV